jgi:hypothetical protein
MNEWLGFFESHVLLFSLCLKVMGLKRYPKDQVTLFSIVHVPTKKFIQGHLLGPRLQTTLV